MSAGFTPGPWFASHDASSGDFMLHYANDEGRGPSLLEGGLVLADDAENAANANLIAAAPALYEALERCVMKLRRCATNAGNADFAVDAVCEEFEAALKQARGEQ